MKFLMIETVHAKSEPAGFEFKTCCTEVCQKSYLVVHNIDNIVLSS